MLNERILTGRTLITGGSGFLGRGILRRAHRENWPADFIVYSRDELKQAQCRKRYKDVRYVLGDVRDVERLRLLFLGVDTVIHTAALKYVPEGETNVSECISVNVDGTAAVLRAAHEAGVQRVVCISTDKAVQPVNVYGATKMLVERLVGEAAEWDTVDVTAVRYGNVIGSTGSVVPVLLEQARESGVITITDPAMTRYWLTVDEAIDLILTALSPRAANGDVIVYNPRSMTLINLVDAITPSARNNIIGLRPGEKMHETLLTKGDAYWAHIITDDIFRIPAVGRRDDPSCNGSLWTSETAGRITAEDFRAAVEDAASV